MFNPALKIFDDEGFDAQITRITGGIYDPLTGEVANSSIMKFTVRVIETMYTTDEVSQNYVEKTDRKLSVLSNHGLQIDDKIDLGGTMYQLIDTTEFRAGSDIMYYLAQARL